MVGVLLAYKDLPSPIKELIDWDQQRQDVQIKYEQVIDQFQPEGMMPEELQALRESERRVPLRWRHEQSLYFDAAHALGGPVFLDSLPGLCNALILVVAGSVVIEDPSALCGAALRPYLQVLLVWHYGLLLGMAGLVLPRRITCDVRVLFWWLVAWHVVNVCLSVLGIAALAVARPCLATAPALVGFSAFEVAATVLTSSVCLASWFAAPVVALARRCARAVSIAIDGDPTDITLGGGVQ